MTALGCTRQLVARKYSDEDVRLMERLYYVEKMTFDAIGRDYFDGASGNAIKTQLRERSSKATKERRLSVPDVKAWDFRGMDV